MSGEPYALDPADPRAPSEAQWAAMSERQRARVVAQLPSEIPRATPPEGDGHTIPKVKAVEALREYFRRAGKRVYIGSELPVYYPDERMFAPDVIVVLDADDHPRPSWVVSHEGRGLDFALEVTLAGDRKKDLELNVERFARLGIPEYFVLDLKLRRLVGYRLAEDPSVYEAIVPQHGRWPSRVLGLDLAREDDRVRFFAGSAPLPDSEELIARMDAVVSKMVAKEQALTEERDLAAARAEEAAARAEEAAARAERLAERLRQLGVDPDEVT